MKNSSHTIAWGAAAAIYFVLATLGHLRFSAWLVNPRTATWQGQTVVYAYRDALPYLLPVVALALLAWLARDALRHGVRQRILVVAAYWLLWAGCVAAVDRWLTFSVPEYFHYPQYALLACLLAKTLDPDRTRWPIGRLLLLTTLLGAIDEMAQYMWITTSYSHYYDFNDVLVNLLAAALGVKVYYGFRSPPLHQQTVTRRVWVAAGLAGVLCLVLAIVSGRVQLVPPGQVPPGGLVTSAAAPPTLYLQRQPGLYDRWHPGAWRPRHWVLGPEVGLALIAGTCLVWWGFGRQRVFRR